MLKFKNYNILKYISEIYCYKTLIYLLTMYMFTTLTYTLWSQITKSPNKIIGLLIFCNILIIYFNNITLKKIMIFFLTFSVVMIAILQTSNKNSYISDGIYFIITIFLLTELNNKYFIKKLLSSLRQSQTFIRFVIILCNIFLCIGFFDIKCYNSSLWEGSYYIGYTNASHTMASGVCLLLSFSLYIIRDKKNIRTFILLIPGIIAILKSGARTFLIPLMVICYFFYIYNIKKSLLKIILLPLALFIISYILLQSSMIDKILFSINNKVGNMGFMGRFTNGRTVFWLVDLLAFQDYNFIQKLLGNGLDFVYILNKKFFNLAIWAHNDIINCLLSFGIIGTCIYIYTIFIICKNILRYQKNNIFIKISLLIYIIIPALLNGFYPYQHYFYSFFVLFILYKHYCYNKKSITRI